MDLLSRPVLRSDHRVFYGKDPSQFGDLWVPETSGRSLVPIVVFLHGGWWESGYDLGYAGYLCSALKKEGIACWSVEYRRVGNTGGGWPNTFRDAAQGFDFVATLAKQYSLDLSRVITMGHSAGGHLAFWLAGRHHLDAKSELHTQNPKLSLRGSLALAGAVDLRMIIDLSGHFQFAHDRYEVYALMGGTPAEQPARYAQANPGDLLPFNVPQLLIQGTEDEQIPPSLPLRWSQLSQRIGDSAKVAMIAGASHLDVVDPQSVAWPTVRKGVLDLLNSRL